MRITLSLIKADVGSVGGHTQPTERMLDAVRRAANKAVMDGLLIDSFVSFTGDDIAILCSHTQGEDAPAVHQLAWSAFEQATEIAKEEGLYGAGQDLLVDAPSANIRGAGPAVAEIEFDHALQKPRPAESFLMFAADKTGPGAYNLPLYLGFADPMYCAGLMLPKMIGGFRFDIIDMEYGEGDKMLSLYAPEDIYHIAALLRDTERFAIDAIWSRQHDAKAVSVSSERLHTIAGEYTGKDDPVALVRTQGIFPAPEELTSPFAKAHFVGGDARGSHNMPLMPAALNTPVTGMYCLPLVSCIGFSLNKDGKFSGAYADLFGNPAWDETRRKAQEKAVEIRSQGFSGPAMLPYKELEYSGFRNTVENLVERFTVYEKTESRAEKESRTAAK